MIRVTTGSRLHFGLLSFGQSTERQFGGFGVMVAQPSIELALSLSEQWEAIGPGAERGLKIARTWLEQRKLTEPAFRLAIEKIPPEHVGFGVGTQLSLAVGAALERYFAADWSLAQAPQLAQQLGRGLRSAVGIHGFAQGGLLVEGGKWASRDVAPLLLRVPFPDNWRWLLVRPLDEQGHSGPAERRAFEQLPPVPLEHTGLMCRELLTHLLPAIQENHFAEFAASLSRYGELAGKCFLHAQSGELFHPQAQKLIELFREWQLEGFAQSSWGPMICVVCPSQAAAEKLQQRIDSAHPGAWEIVITAPRNAGASILDAPG